MTSPLGVYISVPFCKAKCSFCNFASGAFAPSRMQRYVDRVCEEIAAARVAAAALGAELPGAVDSAMDSVDTLYFGGGTPSLLAPEQLRQLFLALRAELTVSSAAEITLECAPGQLSDESLNELLSHGLNRVSLGVQSFVDRESSAIGRLHTEQICLDEIARLRATGVDDINVDLIVGLPHQTEASWRYSLDAVIATGVPHVSVYMLEVDEDSRLGREMLAAGTRYGAAAVPSEDQAADWYQLACDRLNGAGVTQYEISNFACAGHHSRHNLKYWHRHPYVGFGLDAHSMLLTADGAVRFANTSDLDLYSAESGADLLPIYGSIQPALPSPDVDRIDFAAAFEESLFLGLRLTKGVSLTRLRGEFGDGMLNQTAAAIREIQDAGLIDVTSDRMALTDRGRMVSNEVFSRLLLPDRQYHELIPA
jgi:oxygen-independent coproporphyrinogen III oxidase